jgi:chemotaxis response regulator CheB
MVKNLADVEIVDSYSLALTVSETIEIVNKFKPDLIGISLPFSFTERTGLDIAAGIKSLRSDVPVIFGGVQASVRSDELLRNRYVDAVAIGEFEHRRRMGQCNKSTARESSHRKYNIASEQAEL